MAHFLKVQYGCKRKEEEEKGRGEKKKGKRGRKKEEIYN